MFATRMIVYPVSLCLAILPATPAAFAQAYNAARSSPVPDGSVQYELYTENLDRMSRFMRDVRAHIDRSAFDLESLLDTLYYDSADIIDFVKQDIAFEQYPGVLRGAKGTLFSRAGNSIDQALLLAKLLRDAGYDARIAGAELSIDDATAVVRVMKQPAVPAPPFGDAEKILEVLESYDLFEPSLTDRQRQAYVDFVSNPLSAQASPAYESVESAYNLIVEALDSSGAEFDPSAESAALIEEARQYYWVQFRDLAADPWEDVHPVFNADAPFEGVTASTYFGDNVPSHLQHRLRFQVFIERKSGDRLEVLPITVPWERPVANLIGLPLTFSNVADSMLTVGSLNKDLDAQLASSSSFVPSFGRGMAPGACFFDLNGSLIDPMAAQDAAAGLYATINNAFAKALGKVGDESRIPTLTAQWLEFTLIEPGGSDQVYRRTTFDRIGPAARKKGDIPPDLSPTEPADARTLMQRHTFMIDAGRTPRGFVVESALMRFEAARPGIDALLDLEYGRPPRARQLSDIPVGWAGHSALFSLFDAAQGIGSQHRNYRSGPALVVHSEGLGTNTHRVESIDIVSNPRRSVDLGLPVPAIDPSNAMRAGIWETVVEGVLLSGDSQIDTLQAFAAARTAGRKPAVYLPRQGGVSERYPSASSSALQAEVARGYAVVAAAADSVSGTAGWWRIDLETGETLGQIREGRGGEVVGYIVTSTISIAAFTYGAVSCAEIEDPDARTCCHVSNTGMAALTVGIGAGLEGATGAIAAITLDANRLVVPTATICEAVFAR